MKPNNQRGWGLTETLLTLGALSVMSLAIYAVFKPADAQAQVKIEQDNLRELSRAVDRSFGLLGSFDRVSTARLLDDDLAPRRMRRGGGLQTQWGAPVSVDPHSVHQPGDAFLVSYPFTRAEVCAGLASAMAGDAFDIRVNGRSVYDANGLDPAQAAERCADGNATMEFVFHSGLVAGQAVAAPPLVLPPSPPSTSRPPSAPPVMDIPDNEGVDDAAPGVMPTPSPGPSSPPPAPPPVAVPPPPPPSEPIVITDPPPVPVTPPGTICDPAPTALPNQTQRRGCPAGYLGEIRETRTRTQHYTCPEAWDDPQPSHVDYGSWTETSNTCAPECVLPNPSTQTEQETRTGTRTLGCPAGQLGEIQQSRPEARTRSRTASCPAPTGSPTWSSWSAWSSWAGTGSWTTTSNTCAPECVLPNPSTQTEQETRTATREQNCPPLQQGKIVESRPEERTRTRTASCPSPTGSPVWSSWSAWSSWTGTGPWTETSNTCGPLQPTGQVGMWYSGTGYVAFPGPAGTGSCALATEAVYELLALNQPSDGHTFWYRLRTETAWTPVPTGTPCNLGWFPAPRDYLGPPPTL